MPAKNKIIILSDIHIGTNTPTNWYQQQVHEPFVNTALEYVISNAEAVQELIILGDLFDFWTYLPSDSPPAFFDPNNPSNSILSQNPNIFGDPLRKIPGQLGKVVDALGGNVSYVHGNHDMTVVQAELNLIYSTRGYSIKIRPDFYFPASLGNTDIVCTHGHTFSMLCAPDFESTNRIKFLPLGYYVTRTGAYLAAQQLTPQAPNVAYLPNTGEPTGIDFTAEDYARIIGDLFRYSLGGAITAVVNDETGYGWTEPIIMPNGSTVTLDNAFYDFAGLYDTWISKIGLDGKPLGKTGALQALYDPDIENDLLPYAQAMAAKWNSKIVVMGHTHVPNDQQSQQESEEERADRFARDRLQVQEVGNGIPFIYANSGFNCPSIPDMKGDNPKAPTFVEIEVEDTQYTVNIKEVSFTDNVYIVGTLQSQTIGAGSS
jgi:UDP-2,3-diacylglucosamine pyrophosphatase LpxH